MRSRHLLVIAMFAVLPLFDTASAQNVTQIPAGPLTFEVASVKLQPPPAGPGTTLQDSLARTPYMTFRGDRFRAANATATWLILSAYGDEYRLPEQIEGPAWLDRDRFEIDAVVRDVKPAGPDSPLPDAVLEMLRSLLQTRFQLRVKPALREGPVYALVRSRPDGRLGAGISVSTEDCTVLSAERNGETVARRECFPQWGNGRYRRVGHPMERFVQSLERRVGRPVLNETGLSGPVDLDIPSSATSHFLYLSRVDADSGLFTALEDVMGLKLESRRASIPVLVIEHIERPTEN